MITDLDRNYDGTINGFKIGLDTTDDVDLFNDAAANHFADLHSLYDLPQTPAEHRKPAQLIADPLDNPIGNSEASLREATDPFDPQDRLLLPANVYVSHTTHTITDICSLADTDEQ